MMAMRGALENERIRFALSAILVAVVFVLTDHRRDLVGLGGSQADGAVAGPVLGTTIARLVLLGFAVLAAVTTNRLPTYRPTPAVVAIGALMMYLCATTLWADDPAFTFRKLIVLGTVALTAWCFSLVFDLDQIADLIMVVFMGYLLLGIAVELMSGSVKFLRVYRFEGTTGANQNGMFAAVVAVIAGLRLLFRSLSRRATIGYVAVLVIACAVTFVTISRTALFAFAATWVCIAALQVISPITSRRLKAALVATGVGVLGAVTLVVRSNHRSTNLGSFSYRSAVWDPLWDAVGERPLHGYGYLGYWVSGPRNVVENSHSVYLDLLLDGGVIALVLFIVAMGLVLLKLISASRARTDAATLFGIGLLIFALVHGVAESMFNRPTIANFFLMCVLHRAVLDDRIPQDDPDVVDSPTAALLSHP